MKKIGILLIAIALNFICAYQVIFAQSGNWEGINEDQAAVLEHMYNEEMTPLGQANSGWFAEGDNAPCTWDGITCENGNITGLSFVNGAYFVSFPESVLELSELKELRMINLLLRGPLPEDLFVRLPNLQKLDLEGNLLTWEIPSFPYSLGYHPLQKLIINDNKMDDRKWQLLTLPEYAGLENYTVDAGTFPNIDLEPGLDGEIPGDLGSFSSLSVLDLSGNTFYGTVPNALGNLPLYSLDLRDNAEDLDVTPELFQVWFTQENPGLIMEGLTLAGAGGGEENEASGDEAQLQEWIDLIQGQQDGQADQQPMSEEEAQIREWFRILKEQQGGQGSEQTTTEEEAMIQEWLALLQNQQQVPEESSEYQDLMNAFAQLQQMNQPVQPTAIPEPVQNPYGDSGKTIPTAIPTEDPYQDPSILPYGFAGVITDFMNTPGAYEEPQPQVPEDPTPVPTRQPYYYPTQQPYYYPTQQPYYAPTQQPYYPQPQPYYYPTQQPYYYPTQQPYYYPTQQPYYYPTEQPYYYPTTDPYANSQYLIYPTATPYSYYNPNWVYPTATSAYPYPQYVQLQPTAVPTQEPTQDQASLLGFTYKLEAMSENNVPMTWRYTGMTEYSINYLDASGNLYPGFAMEWTPASELCNASVCNASVSIPDELLSQGKFSLQLRTRDAAGKTYVSDAVEMEVSAAQPAPTPEPEQPKSIFIGFLEWLFGPLIRLFGGK